MINFYIILKEKMHKKNNKGTITLTIGDQAENHVGMQKMGEMADEGFSYQDLKTIGNYFHERSYEVEMLYLHRALKKYNDEDKAYVLVIRNGVDALCGEGSADSLCEEMMNIKMDKKALMRGKVVNKIARWNVCFADFNQSPDYEEGKGRVIKYNKVPNLKKLRKKLSFICKDVPEMPIELNYYYDTKKCGIGYHGDSERRKVIGIRLGESIPLCYRWYEQSNVISDIIHIELNHGDIYIMSEKAVGTDWKRRTIKTLRHAAGCEKYTNWNGRSSDDV